MLKILAFLLCYVKIQTTGYCVHLPVFVCVNLACQQWSASCHNRTGRRRFEVACDVAFLLRNTVYAARPCFSPGRAAFKANGLRFLTSRRQVGDRFSTNEKVADLVPDLVSGKIDLMEFGHSRTNRPATKKTAYETCVPKLIHRQFITVTL